MDIDKILNLDKEELVEQQRQAAEQVFRLRFQLRMGQNEGVKKLRELKKDIARMKTVERQREIAAESGETAELKPKRAAKKAAKTRSKSKTVKGRATGKSRKAAKSAGKAKTGSVRAAKRGRANAKKGGS